jgi:hypothetical protein
MQFEKACKNSLRPERNLELFEGEKRRKLFLKYPREENPNSSNQIFGVFSV